MYSLAFKKCHTQTITQQNMMSMQMRYIQLSLQLWLRRAKAKWDLLSPSHDLNHSQVRRIELTVSETRMRDQKRITILNLMQRAHLAKKKSRYSIIRSNQAQITITNVTNCGPRLNCKSTINKIFDAGCHLLYSRNNKRLRIR